MQERRRAELEAKREKLAQIREMKRQREARMNSRQVDQKEKSPVRLPRSNKDINEFIDDILNVRSSTPSGATAPSTPGFRTGDFSPSGRLSVASGTSEKPPQDMSSVITPSKPASGRVSRGSDTGSDVFGQGTIMAPSTIAPENTEVPPTPSPIKPSQPPSFKPEPAPWRSKPEKVLYNKVVQTIELDDGPAGPTEEEIRRRIQAEVESVTAAREQEMKRENDQIAKEIEDEIRELTEEERATVFATPEFLDFVEESSKRIQRALNDTYDYTQDYRLTGDGVSADNEGKRVKEVCAFFDERWTQSRSITDIDWSPKYSELIAASYNKNPTAVNDPDGLVCIWNTHLVDRPEFVFHSQSDVLSVCFSPFHPNLVFGGTYSGQILLWDTRARHLPILKSPLSASGHTYPVYSLQMVGTQNAHNLISSSTDGMVCSWLVDMLAQPQETLELVHSGHNKTSEVAVTTFDFPDNETTTFWAGTEEGNVYQASRYDRAGSKAGLNQHDIYKGHSGPIMGLHFHPLEGPIDFSDIFLTCSVDWTVKLWKAKTTTKPSTSVNVISPLYSFEEADDYVYDVKWHPHHPAIFGSVDGSGRFDLWNLNTDTEVPIISTNVGTGRAINKLAWERKDGRRAALGCSDGRLHVYDIGDVGVPRDSEWADLQKTISNIIAGGASTQLDGTTDADPRPLSGSLNGR